MNKKFSIKSAATLLLALLFSCTQPMQNKEIDASTFQQLLSNNEVQLLDVRTMDEYSSGHIKNALLANWMDKKEFIQHVQYLDKDKPVLVYCASGSRSSQAAKWLTENGFKNIENLKGGFTEWKLENKPVESTSNVSQITIDDYYNLLKNDKPVLVDFGAAWCSPCKIMQPALDSLQKEMKDNFKLVQVDAVNTAVMQQLDVSKLPTFIVYKNGKEVWRKQGIASKDELKKELSK